MEDSKPIKPSAFSTIWPHVKPFVNGGLAGVVTESSIYLGCVVPYHTLNLLTKNNVGGAAKAKAQLHSTINPKMIDLAFKKFPVKLLLEATYTTARLGSYEILTKRVETANDGRPLTIYQEACCGLTAGALGSCFQSPIHLASDRIIAANQFNYRNLVRELYRTVSDNGVLALWKGGAHYTITAMALNMGMLASYNRSFSYLKNSLGYSDSDAQLGAGAISGFFATACSVPCFIIQKTLFHMRPDATGKYPFTGFLDCTFKLFKIGPPSIFYTGFLKHFTALTPRVMLTWASYEEFQKFEKSKGL